MTYRLSSLLTLANKAQEVADAVLAADKIGPNTERESIRSGLVTLAEIVATVTTLLDGLDESHIQLTQRVHAHIDAEGPRR